MPHIGSLILLLPFLLLTSGQTNAQDEPDTALSLLLQAHRSAVANLETKKLAKVNALNPKYEQALDRIKKKHQADNNFEAILAVAHEIKTYARIPAPDDPPAPGKPSKALIQAKKTYLKSIREYQTEFDAAFIAETQDSIKKIRSLAAKLASADDLDEAVVADRARKELESSTDYKLAIARAKTVVTEAPSTAGKMSTGLPRQGLVAHYPLDGNLSNSQPDGAELKLSGGRDFSSGHIGRAIVIENGYDKPKNYIDFPLPVDGRSSSFSISFCLQADMGAHSNRVLMGIGAGKEQDALRFEYQRRGGDSAAVYGYQKGEQGEGDSGGAERPEKEWRHILITYEQKLVSYYINGKLMASFKPRKPYGLAAATGHIPMAYHNSRNDNGDRELGREANMDCLIDDLAIYNRVLRTNEIKEVVKYYRLED